MGTVQAGMPIPGAAAPDISVIIACLNGAATLPEALESLAAQRWPGGWEIVLVDNGSTDASRALFAAFAARHPRLATRLLDASAHPGQYNAINFALAALPSRAFLFCDADDAVGPGWLAAMAAALGEHDFVAARMETGRLNPDWLRPARVMAQERGLARLSYPPFCPHAGGATLGFHRRLFETLGGFDPQLPALADTDFCIRAHLAGFELRDVPDAVYHYRFRADVAGSRRQGYAYARGRAELRRRYGDGKPGFFAPGPWLRLGRNLAAIALGSAARALRLKDPGSHAQQVSRARWIGATQGELAGALAARVPPNYGLYRGVRAQAPGRRHARRGAAAGKP
jgi:glycosyltransferase involved in cell wall biosynthesis